MPMRFLIDGYIFIGGYIGGWIPDIERNDELIFYCPYSCLVLRMENHPLLGGQFNSQCTHTYL